MKPLNSLAINSVKYSGVTIFLDLWLFTRHRKLSTVLISTQTWIDRIVGRSLVPVVALLLYFDSLPLRYPRYLGSWSLALLAAGFLLSRNSATQ